MTTFQEEIKSKFTSEQQKAMLNLIYTGNWLQNQHGRMLEPFGISPQQYNVLRILNGAGKPMQMNEVKCRMLDKTPNLTRLTEKLAEKKLITRTRDELDRRVFFLEITKEGQHLLSLVNSSWHPADQVVKIWSSDEALLLNQLLDKLRNFYD